MRLISFILSIFILPVDFVLIANCAQSNMTLMHHDSDFNNWFQTTNEHQFDFIEMGKTEHNQEKIHKKTMKTKKKRWEKYMGTTN